MALPVIRHIIDGEEMESVDSRRFSSVNPWTRSPWAEVALGSERDVARAVRAARRAFDDGVWPRMGMGERGRILHRLADLVEANSEALAEADTKDMGKPIDDMRGTDVPRTAEYLRFFADYARLATADRFPMDSGHHAYTRYEPAGVVGAITPWNFPLMLATWKVAPALAWGNTVVLKPAETTPTSAAILARLALEAGMPPGVLNVVYGFGPNSAGQALTTSALVDRITFTGESATGRAVSRAAAENLIPVSLELGGKGANLVFDDAELDGAVSWSLQAVYTNAGQICLAGSRIYVQRRAYEEFVERFVAAADELVVGDPMAEGTNIGPLASAEHFAKVTGYLDDVPAEGGALLTGGRGDGWMVRPTVIVDVPASARVAREEVFGPVVVISAFDHDDEAVRLANDTPFGLTAMLFTQNLPRAHRVSAALRAGTVWVNCFYVSDLRAPFGGVGLSGVGREGGSFSQWFFTEPKAVVMEI